jgi:hypothetical protein
MMSALCKAVVAFKLADCEVTNSIFLNSEALLELNRELLRLVLVESSTNKLQQLAYAFSACAIRMEDLYRPYLQQYTAAQHILDMYLKEPRFIELVKPFIETLEDTRAKPEEPALSPRTREASNLKGLLITPVQRICRYKLILKAAMDQVHGDVALLMQLRAALDVSDRLCALINGGMTTTFDTSARRLIRTLERTNSKRGSLIASGD